MFPGSVAQASGLYNSSLPDGSHLHASHDEIHPTKIGLPDRPNKNITHRCERLVTSLKLVPWRIFGGPSQRFPRACASNPRSDWHYDEHHDEHRARDESRNGFRDAAKA